MSTLPSILSPDWGQVSLPFINPLWAFSVLVDLRGKGNVKDRDRIFLISNPLHSLWYLLCPVDICISKPRPHTHQAACAIRDAKQKLRRALQWVDLPIVTICGLDKEESQDSYYACWQIFIRAVGSNCKTNFTSCPSKKVSLGISTAFVKLG